jgi:RsiW-degrading membrane proteinase PrsW (M82 family)
MVNGIFSGVNPERAIGKQCLWSTPGKFDGLAQRRKSPMQSSLNEAKPTSPPLSNAPLDAPSAVRLERIATNRVGLWWALALQLLGLLVFVLFCNLVAPSLGQNLGEGGRIALGFVLSLIPALLWLGIFYGFDRIEPEPKQMVIVTFVAGALLFAALQRPVLHGIFQIDEWLYATWWSRVLGGTLVVGVFELYLVFLAVRYIAFENPEFDERVDGVIYAIAAGLGIATVVNFLYVVEGGGVDIGIGSLRMVVHTLAYGAFAGVLGFFIGQARFEKTPVWYLPAGLGIAALMNGLLFAALERDQSALQPGLPWSDLLLATIVALVALLLVFWLVARANEETLRVARGEAPPARPAKPVLIPNSGALPVAASVEKEMPGKSEPAAASISATESKDDEVLHG